MRMVCTPRRIRPVSQKLLLGPGIHLCRRSSSIELALVPASDFMVMCARHKDSRCDALYVRRVKLALVRDSPGPNVDYFTHDCRATKGVIETQKEARLGPPGTSGRENLKISMVPHPRPEGLDLLARVG